MGGNSLVGDPLIAPDEGPTCGHHPSEEVLIFASCSELRPEDLLNAIEDFSPDEDVASARFLPAHDNSSFVSRPIIEARLGEPLGRRGVKVRQYRTKHTSHSMPLAGLDHG